MTIRIVVLILYAGLATLVPSPQASAQPDPAQILANRHAPVTYLRDQRDPCDRDGEGYFPAPVESVLGNPAVALKIADTGSSQTDTIVKMGPTAEDIAGLDSDYYLDFPGNPRRPGCTFESDFQSYAAQQKLEPTTYAHIVVDEEAHRVVVQYWFWWYFNDWNNLHEGDWEVVQVVFDADSVNSALETEPLLYAYAQHGGGELAQAGDGKLHLVDGHPVVYPAAGSHASHYEQHLYLGWGENGTGFGCDNSTSPATAVPLRAIVVPDQPDSTGEFAWLTFGGRWGERQPWEFNGPRSPNLTGRWADPIGDMENWRDSSLKVPGANFLGPNVTSVFCSLSTSGAVVLAYADDYGRLILVLFAGALLAVALLLIQAKQTLSATWVTFRKHWKIYLGIGLGAVPIGMLFSLLAAGLNRIRPGKWFVDWFDNPESASLLSFTVANGVQYLAISLVVSPAVIVALRTVQQRSVPSIRASYWSALTYFWRLAAAAIVLTVATGLLVSFVIGLVVALWILVRYQFYPQAMILSGARTARRALRVSSSSVQGKWTTTLLVTVLFQVLVLVPGPILGFFLLIFAGVSTAVANLFAAFLYVVTIPISTIGLTLYYQRLSTSNTGVSTVSLALAAIPDSSAAIQFGKAESPE